MLVYRYNEDSGSTYILHLKKNISRNKFLKMMGVKPSKFAEHLAVRMYDNFFSEIIDLFQEYRTYHRQEYENFGLFLRKKYNLPNEIIDNALHILKNNKNSSLFLKREHTSGDYNIEMFLMSEDGCLKYLESILGGSK